MVAEFIIPEETKNKISSRLLRFRKQFSITSELNNIDNIVSAVKQSFETQRFNKFSANHSKDIKYLEIGVGLGGNLINSLKAGYDIVGLEPGDTKEVCGRYDLCAELMQANGIVDIESRLVKGVVEALPFDDKTFDFVFSIAVLEHVKNVRKALQEMNRVLKDRGIMYMNIPNYNSFYEGHYDMLWLPYVLLNKGVAKFYLRLRGRDSSFVDSLNFITPYNIMRLAKKEFKGGSFDCYPHIKGPLSIFGLIYFAHKTNTMNRYSATKSLEQSVVMRTVSFIVSSIVVKSYILLGFAKTFNFIYFKKG